MNKIQRLTPDQLIAQYGAIVTQLMVTLSIPKEYYDDIKQEGYIGLIKAQETYNSRKSSFTTWAWIYIRKYINNAIYSNVYSYGLSSSTYYKMGKIDKSPKTVSITFEDDSPNHIDKLIPQYKNNDFDNTILIAEFCKRIQHLYNEIQCSIIVDYYIEGMKYCELREKYGNVYLFIKKLDLQPIFDDIKSKLLN